MYSVSCVSYVKLRVNGCLVDRYMCGVSEYSLFIRRLPKVEEEVELFSQQRCAWRKAERKHGWSAANHSRVYHTARPMSSQHVCHVRRCLLSSTAYARRYTPKNALLCYFLFILRCRPSIGCPLVDACHQKQAEVATMKQEESSDEEEEEESAASNGESGSDEEESEEESSEEEKEAEVRCAQ